MTSLVDDKSAGFSNVTSALRTSTDERDWEVAVIPEAECRAVVLCTDGVADDLGDVGGFVLSLVEMLGEASQVAASRRLVETLETWPVPGHSDDKTIACLLCAGDADG